MQANKVGRAAIVGFALAVIGVSGIAVAQTQRTPAETIQYRHDQLHRLGAAFKTVNEQARASTPDLAVIRTNAQTISALAAEFPTWFPAGTGPGPGVDTHAKAEIWSNAAGFTDKVHQFQTAAQGLSTAAAGSDTAAIGAAARTLGGACASCHTDFRERS